MLYIYMYMIQQNWTIVHGFDRNGKKIDIRVDGA